MSEAKTKLPVRPEESMAHQVWRPIEGLRREVERLFEDFDRDFWRSSFRRPGLDIEPLSHRAASWGAAPAVDIVEKSNAYEITAELPGIDEKNIELKLSNGGL